MAQVAIYDHALSAQQLLAHYQTGLSGGGAQSGTSGGSTGGDDNSPSIPWRYAQPFDAIETFELDHVTALNEIHQATGGATIVLESSYCLNSTQFTIDGHDDWAGRAELNPLHFNETGPFHPNHEGHQDIADRASATLQTLFAQGG